MSKKLFNSDIIYVVLGLLFITLISIRTISTPEIWTHLAQGRDSAPISYIEPDGIANTTHLYDKVVYGLWNIGGAPVLILFHTAALLAAFILLLRVSREWGGGLSQGFALLISGQLIFQGLDAGPQTIMMLFIALFVYILTHAERPAVLFGALIPLQILWVNTHDSFIFGPIIAALSILQTGAETKRKRKKKHTGAPASLLGILTAALFAATLANPYFAGVYGQVIANFRQVTPFYWGSLLHEYMEPPANNPLVFFVLVLGAGGLITLKKKLPAMLTTLAIVGGFLIVRSPLTANLFAALALPFMVLSFTAVGESLSGTFKNFLGKQEALLKPATQVVYILLIVLAMSQVVSSCGYTRVGSASSFGFGIEDQLVPSGADALIGNPAFPAAEKTVNLPADGGYLAFRHNRQVFLDYRSGCYDTDRIAELQAVMLGSAEAYNHFVETYRPEAFIINTLHPAAAEGIAVLLSRPAWKLAYFDGVTAVILLDQESVAPLLSDTKIQSAGLRRLEAARARYAARAGKCGAGIPAELVGSGEVFLRLNRPIEANAIYSLLLQCDNTVASSWQGLGDSRYLMKDFDGAIEALTVATHLAPDNWYMWRSYARVCQSAGKTAEKDRAIEQMKLISERALAAGEEEFEEDELLEETSQETGSSSLQDLTIPE